MLAGFDMITFPEHESVRFERIGNKWAFSVVLPVRIESVCRDIPVVSHAAEKNVVPARETAHKGTPPVVPLASSESGVACRTKTLAERCMCLWYFLTVTVDMKQRSPAVEHCTTWHANRATSAAGDMPMRKCCTTAYEIIKIWCVDLVVPQRVDRVKTLIVSKENQNVRLVFHSLSLASHRLNQNLSGTRDWRSIYGREAGEVKRRSGLIL